MKDIREQRIERDQAAPRTETPMAMAIPMAEKVQGDTFTRAWAHVPGYAPVLDIPIRSNLIANVILISESLNALLLISSFLLSVKSVRYSLSLSLSLTVARLTVTLRSVCECAIGFGGPLVLCFGLFFFRETRFMFWG